MADAEGRCKFKQRHNGWIATSIFEPADVLLSKAGLFRKLLLREALLLPQSSEVPANQLAHIHLRKLRLTYYEVYLL